MTEAEHRTVEQRTVIHDLTGNRQVALLDGVVVLPVGSEIELTKPNVNVVVERVRFLAGPRATVCLDVRLPADHSGSMS